MQGYRYPNPLNNRRSGTGISRTLQELLLPIYTEDKPEEIDYKLGYFLEAARTLCDLGFFAEYCHLSDDALMLEIICMNVDCDRDNMAGLFVEGNYRAMLEADTKRVLCCPQFELNQKICGIGIIDFGDDPWILSGQLNPIIADTGYQFEFCYYECNLGFLILLSEQEKQKLIDRQNLILENSFEKYASAYNSERY